VQHYWLQRHSQVAQSRAELRLLIRQGLQTDSSGQKCLMWHIPIRYIISPPFTALATHTLLPSNSKATGCFPTRRLDLLSRSCRLPPSVGAGATWGLAGAADVFRGAGGNRHDRLVSRSVAVSVSGI
jgi:hypothetical protein